jgi:hypothetical protein
MPFGLVIAHVFLVTPCTFPTASHAVLADFWGDLLNEFPSCFERLWLVIGVIAVTAITAITITAITTVAIRTYDNSVAICRNMLEQVLCYFKRKTFLNQRIPKIFSLTSSREVIN